MLYPWNAYFGVASNVFLAFVQGWTTLSPFTAGDFVDAYILLPLFPIIWFAAKFYYRAKFQSSMQVDLDEGKRTDLDQKGLVPDDEEAHAAKKQGVWGKIAHNF